MQAKITAPAWKDKPTYFMVTTKDHMIPPSQQRANAARAKAKVVEIDSSHAVMLSRILRKSPTSSLAWPPRRINGRS